MLPFDWFYARNGQIIADIVEFIIDLTVCLHLFSKVELGYC